MIPPPPVENIDLLTWAQNELSARDPLASIKNYKVTPSRIGSLYRLLVNTSDGDSNVYLKVFDPRLTPSGAISDLQAVSGAFGATRDLAFVKVIAALPEAGAVLLEEAEGMPLAVFRKRALIRARVGELVDVWRRAGQWLNRLHWHTAPARPDPDAASHLCDYVRERFRGWARLDPGSASVAESAIEVTEGAARSLGVATLVPCHGDVSAGNIIVGQALTFIDFDDFRFDLPALDLSQAIMETREFGRVASLLPIGRLGSIAERSFRAGYGEDHWPVDAAWLLPHLRNLAVYLVTLAPSRHELAWYSRYRRVRTELMRSIASAPS